VGSRSHFAARARCCSTQTRALKLTGNAFDGPRLRSGNPRLSLRTFRTVELITTQTANRKSKAWIQPGARRVEQVDQRRVAEINLTYLRWADALRLRQGPGRRARPPAACICKQPISASRLLTVTALNELALVARHNMHIIATGITAAA
jgi:hypothetical protein